MAEAEKAYALLINRVDPQTQRFDSAQVANLPEIAQRYFRHAIAPGALIFSGVELEMEGTFLLGDKDSYESYAMVAGQVLRPPAEFVWMPRLRSGVITITG